MPETPEAAWTATPDRTSAALEPELPLDAARAEDERIIVVPRTVLIQAKNDIPDF